MEYTEIKVQDVKQKEKIYTYLKRLGFSENYVKNLRKKEGYILLNNQIAHSDFILKNGDIIKISTSPNQKSSIMQTKLPLNIVYEDENILVVNKPSGLSTSPSKSHYTENLSGAVLSYMLPHNSNFVVRIIGRLDKETSGLIIVAKNSISANFYSNCNQITKTYYAIVNGKIEDELVIDKKIDTTTNELGYNNLKRVVTNNGKDAITYVHPIAYDGVNTLCKINIKYGRTHQIRVHLSYIGHPLVGDTVYGEKSKLISHTALVCKEIELPLFNLDFITNQNKTIGQNKKIHLEIEFPDDFKSAFNTLI